MSTREPSEIPLPNFGALFGALFRASFRLLFGLLFGLVFCLGSLRFSANLFDPFIPWENRPTTLAVGLMVAAGMFYLFAVQLITKIRLPKIGFQWLLILGLLLRILWFNSTPINEDDSYRYFWDGALTYQGLSPYTHAPSDALPVALPMTDFLGITTTDPRLDLIANEGFVERVPYPDIQTIYPPVTQLFFFIHHVLAPWDLDVWRAMLLIVDATTLLLLLKLLTALKKSRALVMIYWLNPLLITETMNAGHMDVLLLPFLVATVLLMIRHQHFWATLCLVVAAGIKLWPIILLPFVLLAWRRYNPQNLVRFLLQTALLIAVGCLIMLPQIVGSVAPTSGIVVYSESWQTNAFLFELIKSGFETFADIDADLLSRCSVVLCLAAFGLFRFRTRFLSRTRSRQSKTSHQDLLALTACLFFLSPTG
jgi:alpha-1,6-mannosyltransferase